MLCLRRGIGERVLAGDVTIEVLAISPGCVKLGFHAERGTPIDREEVFVSKGGELPSRAETRTRSVTAATSAQLVKEYTE